MEKYLINNSVWRTPLLPTIPCTVGKIVQNSICLTKREEAQWQFLFKEVEGVPSPFSQEQEYDFTQLEEKPWQPIVVPGSLIMQGYDIKNNVEYYYRRTITVPSSFAGNRVRLRFEGVYSNARVWVNNHYICTHIGGFTQWDCDITDLAQGELTLVIGVSDIESNQDGIWNPSKETISDSAWASYYAHCNVGGILRDITLYALPKSYIARTHIDTVLDEGYQDAVLNLDLELHSCTANLEVKAELIDEKGNCTAKMQEKLTDSVLTTQSQFQETLSMQPTASWKRRYQKNNHNDKKFASRFLDHVVSVPADCAVYGARITIPVSRPKLWDAEHPHLYQLKLSLWCDGVQVQQNLHQVGFRQICYGGMRQTDKNKVYVNGVQIKLRGVCRHDVSQQYGRSLTNEDIKNEVLAFKRNNINHVRTSHYPVSQYYLEVCDELGIYVEQENSACFKGANGFGIYNAPQDFVNTFSEMVESSRNHPSVLIWSLANESDFEKTYGFRTEYNYIKSVDTTRPVIFSYPHTVKTKPIPYDIYSKHYLKVTGKVGKQDIPMLHDEFAHVACYNIEQLKQDNSCRDQWGESLKKGWENIFATDGALGCAIWSGIDDLFFIPEGTIQSHQAHATGSVAGYGEWGAVLDGYKREKPEAYLTKKAFSPIVLEETRCTFGKECTLFVHNRFDHTSLTEVRLVCRDAVGMVLYDDVVKEAIAPHTSGTLCLKNCKVQTHTMNVRFYHSGYLVEESNVSVRPSAAQPEQSIMKPTPFQTNKTQGTYCLRSDCVHMRIDKKSGEVSILDGTTNKRIVSGPYLYYNGERLEPVKTKKVVIASKEQSFTVSAQQTFANKLRADIKLQFDGENLSVSLALHPLVGFCCKERKLNAGFTLLEEVESVSWKRNTLYSAYPNTHIGRAEGTAYKKRQGSFDVAEKYGVTPQWGWEADESNYFLFTKDSKHNHLSTNDFRTRRNNVIGYQVLLANGTSLSITPKVSEMSAFVDAHPQGDSVSANLQLGLGSYYPELEWGNDYGKRLSIKEGRNIQFSLALKLPERESTI